jgi:hypothetical protein
MIAPSPMVPPGMTTASQPIHISFPITVLSRLWILGENLRGHFEPASAEDEKREKLLGPSSGGLRKTKGFGPRGNGTELTDDQLLGTGCVVHVPSLEESRIVRVVVVG